MNRDEYLRMDKAEAGMWWFRALHDNLICLIDRAGIGRQSRLLDAGCGTGGLLRRLGDERPGLGTLGLDIDPQAAEIARAKSLRPVCVGSLSALPFLTGSLDLILSADVLCHRAVDEAAALADLHRALRPGGVLVLSLPAYDWLFAAHDRAVHTARRYTARRLRARLAGAGFPRVRTGYWNTLPFPLMVVRRKLMARVGEQSDVAPFPPFLERIFGIAMAIEHRLLSLGLRLPFGGSVWAVAWK